MTAAAPDRPTPMADLSAPAPVLRNREFWLLWSAYVISAFGDHIAQMSMMGAMGFDHRTDPTDKLHLSCWLQLAFFLPFAVLGPLTGWLADRLPRRALMITADLARAALLVLIPGVWFAFVLHGHTWDEALGQILIVHADPNRPYWHGAVPYLLIGLFAALFSPARAALVPTLVRDSDLVRANALIGGAGVIFSGIALPIGGYLAQVALGPSFLITAVTFLASATCLFLIRVRQQPGEARHLALKASPATDSAPPAPHRVPKPTFRDGVSYVLSHRRVREALLVSALFWGLVAIVTNGVTVGAATATELGVILGTFTFGMLAGAVAINFLGRAAREDWVLTLSLIGMGVFLALYALTSPSTPAGPVLFVLRGVLAFFTGAFGVGVKIAVETLMQRLSPDRIRGRIFGLNDVLSMWLFLALTVGLMIPPNMGQHLGVIFAFAGLACLGLGVWTLVVRYRRDPIRPFMLYFWTHFTRFWFTWVQDARRIGACTVPRTGPVLIVANHRSTVDPLIIQCGSMHRPISWMVAREHYEKPVAIYFCTLSNCIPVNRTGNDTAAFKQALRRLRDGGAMGIFPQGTVEEPGEELGPKVGVAMLALHSGATIVPAYVIDTPFTGESTSRAFITRSHSAVRFGKPIDVAREYADRRHDKTAVAELTDRLWGAVLALKARHQAEQAARGERMGEGPPPGSP